MSIFFSKKTRSHKKAGLIGLRRLRKAMLSLPTRREGGPKKNPDDYDAEHNEQAPVPQSEEEIGNRRISPLVQSDGSAPKDDGK